MSWPPSSQKLAPPLVLNSSSLTGLVFNMLKHLQKNVAQMFCNFFVSSSFSYHWEFEDNFLQQCRQHWYSYCVFCSRFCRTCWQFLSEIFSTKTSAESCWKKLMFWKVTSNQTTVLMLNCSVYLRPFYRVWIHSVALVQDQVLSSSLTRRLSLSFPLPRCGPFFSSSWSSSLASTARLVFHNFPRVFYFLIFLVFFANCANYGCWMQKIYQLLAYHTTQFVL